VLVRARVPPSRQPPRPRLGAETLPRTTPPASLWWGLAWDAPHNPPRPLRIVARWCIAAASHTRLPRVPCAALHSGVGGGGGGGTGAAPWPCGWLDAGGRCFPTRLVPVSLQCLPSTPPPTNPPLPAALCGALTLALAPSRACTRTSCSRCSQPAQAPAPRPPTPGVPSFIAPAFWTAVPLLFFPFGLPRLLRLSLRIA
jgi:hypothetical protein